MLITQEMITALRQLRSRADGGWVSVDQAEAAFKILDESGIFGEIDEIAEARALDLLAESAARSLVKELTGQDRRDPLALMKHRNPGA